MSYQQYWRGAVSIQLLNNITNISEIGTQNLFWDKKLFWLEGTEKQKAGTRGLPLRNPILHC